MIIPLLLSSAAARHRFLPLVHPPERGAEILVMREFGNQIMAGEIGAGPLSATARFADYLLRKQRLSLQFAFHQVEDVLDLPPPAWLIDAVLPCDSLGVMFAPSGAGKTFVALGMAACVVTGREWSM